MNSLLSPDEGDFLNHFMHEDDIFSDMLDPSFYTEQPTATTTTTTTTTTTEPPPQPQPQPPTPPPPDNHNPPKRKDRDTEKLHREPHSITKRLGPTRRTSRSPPPLKRQALDPPHRTSSSSSQRTPETTLRDHSPSNYSRHSSTRFRSPALCSRSRSRTPPRASYRRSADRRGTSSDRDSLRTRSRHPLPPQNEARTNKSPPEKTTTTKSREENRQGPTNPDTVESKSREVTKNHHSRSTDKISTPQKKISSSSSSSNIHSSRGEKSPSPPKAPAALRKYSLHHQSPPPSSPAQVARAAKAAAEASRLRNLRKREQIQHRLAPSSSSTFSRPHSSSIHRPIPRSITLMDDSEPPPTAPAADLRKEKQKQPPSPHTSDAGVGNIRTGSSLTNRNRSSSHGSLTPSTIEDVESRSKAEGVDKSTEDVKGKVMEEVNTDSESLAPPSKPDQTNRSPSLPKNTAPSRPPIPPKKPIPKRYGPNHNPGYWTGTTSDPNFDNHFGLQRHMQALPNSLNLNQMMIPNIGMTINLLHNPAMNPNMAMMGGANMIPFLHTANRSARMNYQGVDMNLGMGDAPPHGYGMEYQGLMQPDMGMGMGMGGMNSPWAGSEEGMYNEQYNYVSNGNADVNSGIMGMTDAVGYNYGNGVQNSWGYSGSSTDFGTNYGNGILTRTSGNRSRGTSTPDTHDSADALSVNSNATSGDGNNQLDTSNSIQPPKRRPPRSYNNNNNPDVPLIRFVGTPPPVFPFSNFQPGQIPQFPNPGFFG